MGDRLREVAEEGTLAVELLGVEPGFAGERHELVEHGRRLVDSPRARECGGEPERAGGETPLVARQAVVVPVAVAVAVEVPVSVGVAVSVPVAVGVAVAVLVSVAVGVADGELVLV